MRFSKRDVFSHRFFGSLGDFGDGCFARWSIFIILLPVFFIVGREFVAHEFVIARICDTCNAVPKGE